MVGGNEGIAHVICVPKQLSDKVSNLFSGSVHTVNSSSRDDVKRLAVSDGGKLVANLQKQQSHKVELGFVLF